MISRSRWSLDKGRKAEQPRIFLPDCQPDVNDEWEPRSFAIFMIFLALKVSWSLRIGRMLGYQMHQKIHLKLWRWNRNYTNAPCLLSSQSQSMFISGFSDFFREAWCPSTFPLSRAFSDFGSETPKHVRQIILAHTRGWRTGQVKDFSRIGRIQEPTVDLAHWVRLAVVEEGKAFDFKVFPSKVYLDRGGFLSC